MVVIPATSVRAHAAKGIAITGVGQALRLVLTFGSGILLARLLTPADFGLIAMVSTSVAFIAVIQDLGINQATIQREAISKAQMSALFWLSAGVSALLALVLASSAPIVAWFFGDPRLVKLTVAFSIMIVLVGFQSQQIALLNRQMRFKALAAVDVLAAAASAVIGVTLAWQTGSYWALFATSLTSTLTSLVCAWVFSGWKPGRPSFEGDFSEIFHFGAGVSGFNILAYFSRNADNLLIGRFYGSDQLGLYDRAYRLLLFPLYQVIGPLGRVMLPTLARLQTDPVRYRNAYIECITLVMTLSQPGLVCMCVFAEELFLLLLGPRWVPAAPIFRWLGVCALLQVMTWTVGWLYLSQGRGGDYFKIGLFGSLITVASFMVGLPWGPIGVATAYTICEYLLRLPLFLWSAGQRGPVTTRDLWINGAPHFLATGLTAAGLVAGSHAFLFGTNILTFVIAMAFSYVFYGAVIMLWKRKRDVFYGASVSLWQVIRVCFAA
jgi:PST family polysaccharide transporter